MLHVIDRYATRSVLHADTVVIQTDIEQRQDSADTEQIALGSVRAQTLTALSLAGRSLWAAR